MICINNDIILEEKEDFDNFIETLKGEVYNEETRLITDCIISFLNDVWTQDQKLTEMIHRKISEDFFSVVNVEVEETAPLDKVQVGLFSKDKGAQVLTADKIAFEQFCNMYFGGVKPLYDRFTEINL